jgi:hypothetical protein
VLKKDIERKAAECFERALIGRFFEALLLSLSKELFTPTPSSYIN